MPRIRGQRHEDERLDHGLKETFPASDPIAVGRPTATEAPRRPVDREAVMLSVRTNIAYVAFATVCGAAFIREF